MNDLVVREAAVAEILAVRKAVLRPGEPVEPSDYDATPEVRHVGAFDEGTCVGCATVFPSPYVDSSGRQSSQAWQLRGMAVDPGHRARGVGRAVLDVATDLARATGTPMMWANARTTALGFYRKAGWHAVGEEFTYGPARLPHYVIVLPLG